MKSIFFGVLPLIAASTINYDDDELEWAIDDNDQFDDRFQYTDYEYDISMLEAEFYGEPNIRLKSADTSSPKATFTNGGIRVRNMGRIMKMAMFIQKKPAKGFIREFKRYGCHCWPKGRTILGGQGRPQDDVDRTCKKLFNCHRCLVINSNGECGPDKFQYKVRGKDNNGTRLVHCDGNPADSCQRNLCECDLAFAQELNEARKAYKNENSKWKGFKTNDECRSGNGLGARTNMLQQQEYEIPTGTKMHNGWACCGSNFENLTPYKPAKGQRCCNNNNLFTIYGLDKSQTCCSDGSVADAGFFCPS